MATVEPLPSTRNREWGVREELSGWRLLFKDPGDTDWTNAGVFSSRAAAIREAAGRDGRRTL